MKKMICLQFAVLLLLGGLCASCNREKTQEASRQDKVVLYAAPDLFELTREWAAVFCKLNPEIEIEVIQSDESAIAENLDKSAKLNFVTGDFESEINKRPLWKLTIGRDIIVPVVNAENPYILEMREQGISPSELARILNKPGETSWKDLIEEGPDVPAVLYTINDPALQAGIARFLDREQVSFRENSVSDPRELVASVRNTPYSLGICYLTDIIDQQSKQLFDNIELLPVDRNGNGLIDYKEDVYASLESFTRGVWIGKYPGNLAENMYTVSSQPPAGEDELAFLNWVYSRGHVLLNNHGIGNLPEFERQAHITFIDGLRDNQPAPGYTLPREPGFFTGPMPYVLAFMLLLTILLYFSIRSRNRSLEGRRERQPITPGLVFNENQVDVSPGLYYDKTHTWAFMEEDGSVKVGIDDFLQRVTGPLTRVKMKSPGERIKKGKKALSIIQDGKQLDIAAPVSGTIKEFNPRLSDDSLLLNSSPYKDGWIYRVEPANWFSEVQFLILGTTYKVWLKKEFQRLKEFLSETLKTESTGYAHVLQDGGELREHILKDMGPEMWEEFQTNFLDMST